MDIVTWKEFEDSFDLFRKRIEEGAVFVYPTDTIYGIGCDARNSNAVSRIREIKQRSRRPFSVIAPSMDWIHAHCVVSDIEEDWKDKLPGRVTILLRMDEDCVEGGFICRGVVPETDILGVRIPDHAISGIVSRLGFPVVTTSVNVTGEEPLQELSKLWEDIKRDVDFAIDEGTLSGRASTVFDYTKDHVEIVRK